MNSIQAIYSQASKALTTSVTSGAFSNQLKSIAGKSCLANATLGAYTPPAAYQTVNISPTLSPSAAPTATAASSGDSASGLSKEGAIGVGIAVAVVVLLLCISLGYFIYSCRRVSHYGLFIIIYNLHHRFIHPSLPHLISPFISFMISTNLHGGLF